MHPYMTAELVRQLRAGLDGEARTQRRIRPLPPRARTDPARGRVSPQRRGRWRARSAPWWPGPPEPATYEGRHDNPPRAQWTWGHHRPISSDLRGTWTIDPATSIVSFARRALRLWTVTGRRQCLGVIHLDELPPVGVIRFRQPSGLPFLALAVAAFIALRRPVLRRLALRQIGRRRAGAALVVAGSVLGPAIIIGSLIVGDTLNFSVRQAADDNLGPTDEVVSSPTVAQGDEAARRIERLRGDPDVDGILSLHGDRAAVTRGSGQARKAEPRASVWEVDFAKATAVGGGVRRGSGLSGPAPGPGEAVINQDLADAIGAHRGETLTVYLYGKAREAH